MYSAWTQHITDNKEKEDFRNSVLGAKRVLERLKALMQMDLEALNLKEVNTESYEIPNWDYKQAHTNGNKACLYKYLKLIDLDQQNRTETKE